MVEDKNKIINQPKPNDVGDATASGLDQLEKSEQQVKLEKKVELPQSELKPNEDTSKQATQDAEPIGSKQATTNSPTSQHKEPNLTSGKQDSNQDGDQGNQPTKPSNDEQETEESGQPEQPEDQQTEEEQQDDNGPDRPDEKEEPEEQAEEEPAKEEPAEEQPAEEQPETEAQTEEGAPEEPAGETTDAAGKTGEDLGAEGTDAAGGGGEGLATDAVDAAGGTGEGLSTGAVDAAGGTGEALTTATPAAGAAGAGEAAAAAAETAAATAEAEAAGAGIAAGGWIVLVIIAAVILLIIIIVIIYGYAHKSQTDKTDASQAGQITLMTTNIQSGNISFDDPLSQTNISNGAIGIETLTSMNDVASQHESIKFHYSGINADFPSPNENYTYDIVEVDKIKCTDTANGIKALEIPINLSVNFNWASAANNPNPQGLLCAGDYYPQLDQPVTDTYSETYGPNEFRLADIASAGPKLAQQKIATLATEIVANGAVDSLSATNNKTIPHSILINQKYVNTNFKSGGLGLKNDLLPTVNALYTDPAQGKGIEPTISYPSIHISFD